MHTLLDQTQATLESMPLEMRQDVIASANEFAKGLRWIPNPGPQSDAYFSEADVLLYGGEPGGGKSQLILGLAFNNHERSFIIRRQYSDLDRLVDDALKIHGSREGFNGSPPPTLKLEKEKFIRFMAFARVGDEQHTMGQGRDFLGIDEGTQLAESQVRFLMGWLRSEKEGQRCRTVIATNPPLSAEGWWVVKMFAPWLDPKYPYPAKPAELRWVITDEDGHDKWVDGPAGVMSRGKLVFPKSRTFIPSSVNDNPYYASSGYERELDAMSEPWRSLLMGGFKTTFMDAPNQVIPTAWIQLAQERWTKEPPEDVPMCSIGVDCSGGGQDPMTIAPRYDGWFAPITVVKGKDIPMEKAGQYCAGQILAVRRDNADVVVDMGGGYGSSTYEHLFNNDVNVVAYKGSEGTTKRTKDGKRRFVNKRSAAIWSFYEALDPSQSGGSPIMLPDDPLLVADLTAPTFEEVPNGINVESKEKVCNRLGRSTDHGDAVIMAWFEGARKSTNALEWMEQGGAMHRGKKVFTPRVITGGRQPLSARR